MESIDRRKFLQKAGVATAATGVVWAAPSVVGSSAAFAWGSVCGPRTLDWNTFTEGSTFTSALVTDTTVAVTQSTFRWGSGSNTSATGSNRQIVPSPHGGITGRSLQIEQNAVEDAGQNTTFSFRQDATATPALVKNIQFTITDIDTSNGSWSDRVAITGAAFTVVSKGNLLYGRGENTNSYSNNNATNRAAGPFRSNTSNNLANSDGRGNATINIAGPVSSFTIKFWSAEQESSNQLIKISNITFNTCP